MGAGDIALTDKEISLNNRRMARPKKFVEDMVARFAVGTFARITAVLRSGEDRADFVREAVERQLTRRERTPKKEKPPIP